MTAMSLWASSTRNALTIGCSGIPVYFYLVFTAVKLPLLTVLGFLVGLPLLFRRKLGDGRYFILFWLLLWVVAFCFPGGKFTRYYTTVLAGRADHECTRNSMGRSLACESHRQL